MEDQREWIVQATRDICEDLGYKRPLKVVFREHEIEGFNPGIIVAKFDKVGNDLVELPEWELRVSPTTLEELSIAQLHHRLARMLLAASPGEERRNKRLLIPLVAIPILWVAAMVFLAFKVAWWMVLGAPLAYFVITAEVFVAAPFIDAPTRMSLKVLELTGDAITPLEIARKRLSNPLKGERFLLKVLDRISDRIYIRRFERNAAKLGYRTNSLPDA